MKLAQRFGWLALVLGITVGVAPAAHAADAIDKADTVWMLVSSALVLLMVPGLALFYGGMVRSQNVLSTVMHSLVAMGLLMVQWVIIGYSLAFGTDQGGLVGGFNFAFLNGVGVEPNGTIPHLAFMLFQGMFAIITPALISGAFAERMKFSSYLVFTLAWATLVYDPIAHWVWHADGWLFKMGAMDFAGGVVVHLNSGIAGLVLALVLGPRLSFKKEKINPNNLVFTVLGAGLLWFGWFGFNAGSALAVGELATVAFVNTQIAAAAAMLGWMLLEKLHSGKASALGAASGAVAGLVVITPAAGFVSPMGSLAIGLIGGLVCAYAVTVKFKFNYDDSLDAFGVHGVGGLLGALLTGVFATKLFNPASQSGWLEGNGEVMVTQLISVAVPMAYTVAATFVIAKVIDWTMGLRVTEEEEREGLDTVLHSERAYHL